MKYTANLSRKWRKPVPEIIQLPKLGKYDESISILKGQLETHNQKINLHCQNIDKLKLEIKREERSVLQYEARIKFLAQTIDDLTELKAKGE